MSATINTNKLSEYFGGLPHIHIGGSCFPVQQFFLEDVLRLTGSAHHIHYVHIDIGIHMIICIAL
jgi:HrpA-like RNA helicase